MQYYSVEPNSWVAINTLDNYPAFPSKAGSKACRQLLLKLQQQLGLIGALNDAEFPYFFETMNHQRYFVSFSHSRMHIAVLISKQRNIGIDIEDGDVSDSVVHRFFSPDEIVWIKQQPVAHQASLRKLFWCLKECFIKSTQKRDTTLITELKRDLIKEIGTKIIYQLINKDGSKHPAKFVTTYEHDTYVIGKIPNFHSYFVIQKA